MPPKYFFSHCANCENYCLSCWSILPHHSLVLLQSVHSHLLPLTSHSSCFPKGLTYISVLCPHKERSFIHDSHLETLLALASRLLVVYEISYVRIRKWGLLCLRHNEMQSHDNGVKRRECFC